MRQKHGVCADCREHGRMWTYGGRHLCRGCYNRAVWAARGLRGVVIR